MPNAPHWWPSRRADRPLDLPPGSWTFNPVASDEPLGDLAALPSITLLGNAVKVTPAFRVAATLGNQTGLRFAVGAALTVLEAHAVARYNTT